MKNYQHDKISKRYVFQSGIKKTESGNAKAILVKIWLSKPIESKTTQMQFKNNNV